MRIANVSYYFYLLFHDQEYPVAVVNLFSLPDATLLTQSSQTVWKARRQLEWFPLHPSSQLFLCFLT